MPTIRLRATRATALVAAAILASSAASRAVAASVPSVFGGRVPCVAQSGVQFCAGGISTRVESRDGVPLDVNLTLPAATAQAPFPLIVQLHGWSQGKTAGAFVERARDGYAVLSYSARGFHGSCGSAASRAPDGDAIATPAAHVLPAPEAKGSAARACRLAGQGGTGTCPTVGTVRGERG